MNEGHVFRSQIGAREAGRTVLEELSLRPGDWLSRIAAGAVLLDGAPAQPGTVLRAGQWLSWARPPWEEPDVPLCAAVLYEDAELLGVAKPRGLPTLPGGGEFQEHTLLAVVRRRAPEATPMHRLGRGTSGVVLFARTRAARRTVQEAFREHHVRKLYRALCSGLPAEDRFSVDAPIGEVQHEKLGTVRAATLDGRPSHTGVRVLQRRPGCTLVEAEITTGRPHQIRIHLAFAGHPLVGDPLYAAGGVPGPQAQARPGDLGYWLHSAHLSLAHPRTGARVSIDCAPPPILR